MAQCHQIKANSDQMVFFCRSPSFVVTPKSFTVNKRLLEEGWKYRVPIDEETPVYTESIDCKW